jgi:hypothetical protein
MDGRKGGRRFRQLAIQKLKYITVSRVTYAMKEPSGHSPEAGGQLTILYGTRITNQFVAAGAGGAAYPPTIMVLTELSL